AMLHRRADVVTVAHFFFQAEDGIRDYHVTGVQTCALPILRKLEVVGRLEPENEPQAAGDGGELERILGAPAPLHRLPPRPPVQRSEERRVGKECRSRWSPHR